jgi:hypothetical protein
MVGHTAVYLLTAYPSHLATQSWSLSPLKITAISIIAFRATACDLLYLSSSAIIFAHHPIWI